tara:strand:- start:23346 stop:24287 length:942 start_codon:yes stop_codon:yes gene_type:complete
MKLGKVSLLFLLVALLVISCKKDDVADNPIVIELRDRAEQQVEDKVALLSYLENYYYNSEELASITNPSISDIIITGLADGVTVAPDGYTKLSDPGVVQTKSVVYADTDYVYYLLKLNQGGGDSPTFADNIQILYEGFTIDNAVFDSKFYPDNNLLDLSNLIAGWQKVIPDFNTAESYVENGDGTVNYINKGLGVMFLPSGLGYFPISANSSNQSLWYSPLIFKFELLQYFENDHDNDGIPSYLEDLDGDGVLVDENTDGDFNPNTGFPLYNYLDNDDDGDGILTINEDTDKDGDPTNDIGSNGIARYLDPTE